MLVADLWQGAVWHVFVSVYGCVNINVFAYKPHERAAAGVFCSNCFDVAATFDHTNNRSFAILAAVSLCAFAGKLLEALVIVLVAVFAAYIGFVHFNLTSELFKAACFKYVAYALEHKPSGRLTYFYELRELD